MTRSYSAPARRNLLATSADEPFLVLLEITHPDLAVPIRVVNDTQNVTVSGNEFVACAFDVTWPDDADGQIPQAQLQIDNIGRDLTVWLEQSNGGRGAQCRLMQVLRSTLAIEMDITFDLTGMSIDNQKVNSNIGYQNLLAQVGTTVNFTPATAPGLF